MLDVFLIWLSGAIVVLLFIGGDVLYHKYLKKDYSISLGEFALYTICSWITILAGAFWTFDKIGKFVVWLIARDICHKELKITFNKERK